MTDRRAASPLPRSRAGRTQLPDEVATYVREQIMSAVLPPGEFLRMEPIAEALGVSLTPVREGLLKLAAEGFVESLPRRGFVVAEFTRQDVRDLFWAQSKLAGELAARAATRITDDQLAELAVALVQCEAAIADGDTARIGELGHRFHRLINLAADSARLARTLAMIVRQLPNSYYAAIEAHIAVVAGDHREVLAALTAHDPERARAVIERHTVDSADHVVTLLERRGLWGRPGADG